MQQENRKIFLVEDFSKKEWNNKIRLDKFLSVKMLGVSRSCIQKWIENGFVQVNNRKEPCNYRTKSGDIIEVNPQKVRVLEYAKPQDISLDIVYEDDYLLVVNKPAGMVTHPAPGHYEGTLVNALLGMTKRLSRLGGEFRPGIVHRLDKDTSGLIIIAKDENVHYKLAEQFKKREVYRQYIAIVSGSLKNEQRTITASLVRHPKNRKKFCIDNEKGREAITKYRVLERGKNATLLEIFPITGRTHQIRVHLAHLGHPILGDLIYGKKQGFDRQALHAKSIGFLHPVTNQHVRLESPLPDDMKKMWEMFVRY